MRTILKTDKGIISGEDINGHCVRVTIEGRNDLGSVILSKDISELEEGELQSAGEALLGREINTEFGTFILKGDKLYMRGREEYCDVSNMTNIEENIALIYDNTWREDILKEKRAEERKQKALEKAQNSEKHIAALI